MNIIQVTPEIYPFSRFFSISEAVSSLSLKLAALGENVSVFTPLYASIDINKYGIKPSGLKTWVDAGYTVYEYELYECELENIKYVFFKNDELFNRLGLYGTGTFDYADNDIRFATFCQAVMNYITYHSIPVDIIHSHDWSTALIPVYKKINFTEMDCKTVLTLHSSDNLGVFNKFCMDSINLPWSLYNIDELEYFDCVSFLKGGVVYADYVTTVSPSFAKELASQEFGLGLDWLFEKYTTKLRGILSGINHDLWCPEKGKTMIANFSKEDTSGKKICRNEINSRYGLNPNYPIITHVSRLGASKGIELILDILPKLASMDINVVIMGINVNPVNMHIINNNKSLHKNIKFILAENDLEVIDMLSATDIMLMPSLYESRGVQLMLGMCYGAIPVVRRTGGLVDIVSQAIDEGVGFIFDDYNCEQMYDAIIAAIDLFNSNEHADTISKIMSIDVSIDKTAKEYIELYKELLEEQKK